MPVAYPRVKNPVGHSQSCLRLGKIRVVGADANGPYVLEKRAWSAVSRGACLTREIGVVEAEHGLLGDSSSMFRLSVLGGLLCLGALAALATDTAKERRWAEQITDFLVTGEAEWLNAGGQRFLSIYTRSTTPSRSRGVVLLHGSGAHPDWPLVIFPLRTGLADRGWHTLSLQMPIRPPGTTSPELGPLFLDEVPPRIDAALKFLGERGIREVALIGHSLGSAMGAYYLASRDSGVGAFVGVGTGPVTEDWPTGVLSALERVRVPVLDVIGSRDETLAHPSIRDRLAGAAERAGNERYTQILVPGADHFFEDKEDELLRIVDSWLADNLTAR